METNTNVIHPTHYNQNGKKECWEEMIEIFGADAVIVFDCMNAYKYHYRAGYKLGNPAEQDLGKMENYINHAEKLVGEYPVTNETLKVIEEVKARLIEESEDEFKKVTQPVIEWLQKNGCPHDYILIECASAELLNGKMGYSVDKIKESEE